MNAGRSPLPRLVKLLLFVVMQGIAAILVGFAALFLSFEPVWSAEGQAFTSPGEVRSASAVLATELYELLDSAMSAQGLPRSPGMPPLRHAEALALLDHPLADEILAAMWAEGPGTGAAHGHYNNMVNAAFTGLGVGLVFDANGLLYFTNDFSG